MSGTFQAGSLQHYKPISDPDHGCTCVGRYLERVLPAATGAPLPWWFPASAAYWRHGDISEANSPGRRGILQTLAAAACRMLPLPQRWHPRSGPAYERVEDIGLGEAPESARREDGVVHGVEVDDASRGGHAGVEDPEAAPVSARLSGLWKACPYVLKLRQRYSAGRRAGEAPGSVHQTYVRITRVEGCKLSYGGHADMKVLRQVPVSTRLSGL